jgi:hypothetical protein
VIRGRAIPPVVSPAPYRARLLLSVILFWFSAAY